MEVDHKLDRIENKLDKVHERINSIDVTLAGQHVSLVEHIRRTTILEDQIKPIQSHVAMVSGVLKFIGIIAMIAAIGEGIAAILTYLKG
jgi:archaellum component FlaC